MKIQSVFEALSDENRRKILELLKKKDMSVNELLERFDISGASLSHHLNKLKNADLVLAKRQGQQIIYPSLFIAVGALLLATLSGVIYSYRHFVKNEEIKR